MSQHILAQIQEYLRKAQEGPVEMSDEVIEEFGEACKNALRKQFHEPKKQFTLRMSSIGRPLCQQKLEAEGDQGEPQGYNATFRNLIGDLIEAAGVAVMRAAKVQVNSVSQKVKLPIGGIELSGTYDVEIENKIWDIKTASPYSFTNFFGSRGGFGKIVGDDHFGYVTQGYAYSEATKKPFGGWIVIQKVTGEWNIVDAPATDAHHRTTALDKIDNNIRAIKTKEPFKREFEDEEETFNKKLTGNRTLGITCSYCAHKMKCWPNAVQMPQAKSKAKTPKLVWYSEFTEEVKDARDTTNGDADSGGNGSSGGAAALSDEASAVQGDNDAG